MKDAIDSTAVDIDCVCVDSPEVRDTLLEDDRFAIRSVPSAIVFYTNKRHKVYTKKSLESWFGQLMKNIQLALTPVPEPQVVPPPPVVPEVTETGISEKTTSRAFPRKTAAPGKAFRRPAPPPPVEGVTGAGGRRRSKKRSGSGESSESEGEGANHHLAPAEPETSAIESFLVGEADFTDLSGMGGTGPGAAPIPSSVKRGGSSAKSLADEMKAQREMWQQQEDSSKPFL